jgi:hypothetical protein
MEIIQNDLGIAINQDQYVHLKLQEFDDYLEKNVKRAIPLDPNDLKLLEEAEVSDKYENHFPCRDLRYKEYQLEDRRILFV